MAKGSALPAAALLATELDAVAGLDELATATGALDVVTGLTELEAVVAGCELAMEAALDDEELLVAALDDDTVAAELATLEEAVAMASILNQLILKPPLIEVMPNLCAPAVRVTVRVMVVQVCQPPVPGTVTVS